MEVTSNDDRERSVHSGLTTIAADNKATSAKSQTIVLPRKISPAKAQRRKALARILGGPTRVEIHAPENSGIEIVLGDKMSERGNVER